VSDPDEPAPEIDLHFKEDFGADRILPQEIELLGSLYPELIVELVLTREEE
jgi:hypothetical protein